MAFGLVRVGNSALHAVQDTAAVMGIPCFLVDERTFADAYAIPRTIRALVASTPVGAVKNGGARDLETTCEDGAHLPFIAVTSAYLARAAQEFLGGEQKIGFEIHPGGATRT